ncbi:MAG TPA: antitoxin MazE family protein [Reyranella sp.]|jgi:hypothetical protein
MAMPKSTPRKSSRDKVSAHRARLRAQGLRPIQIWVPDVRSPQFIKEARRQSRLAAQSAHAADDQAFIDSISELKFE